MWLLCVSKLIVSCSLKTHILLQYIIDGRVDVREELILQRQLAMEKEEQLSKTYKEHSDLHARIKNATS